MQREGEMLDGAGREPFSQASPSHTLTKPSRPPLSTCSGLPPPSGSGATSPCQLSVLAPAPGTHGASSHAVPSAWHSFLPPLAKPPSPALSLLWGPALEPGPTGTVAFQPRQHWGRHTLAPHPAGKSRPWAAQRLFGKPRPGDTQGPTVTRLAQGSAKLSS